MADLDLLYTPAAELAGRIRRKELSPVELVDAVLARIGAMQPTVNAFITVTAETARAEAKAAEQAVMEGRPLGPLHGIPFSVKDLTPTAGVRTTMGSAIFADHVPAEDAVPVARARAAGAILVGKTTTPEFGHKPLDRRAPVRPHGQSVGSQPDLRRLERWRSGGGLARHGTARLRHRWRRLGPHPGGMLWHRRPQGDARADSQHPRT